MFNILLQLSEINESSLREVPVQLEQIQGNPLWFVGIILFFGIILIALTRLLETNFLRGITASFLSLSSDGLQRNQVKLDSIPSMLLLINYFICLWACFVLFINAFLTIEVGHLLIWSAICVAYVVIYQFVGLGIVAWVTGETSFAKHHVLQTIVGLQFAGAVFLILGVFWSLYPQFRIELFYSFAIILVVLLTIRFIRGIASSLMARIPWYYIILYFCTLEILPLLVTYYYVAQNFKVSL